MCVLDAATGAGLYSWYAPAGAAFAPASLGVQVNRDPAAAYGFSLEFPGAGLLLSDYWVPTTTYRIDGTESDLYADL